MGLAPINLIEAALDFVGFRIGLVPDDRETSELVELTDLDSQRRGPVTPSATCHPGTQRGVGSNSSLARSSTPPYWRRACGQVGIAVMMISFRP